MMMKLAPLILLATGSVAAAPKDYLVYVGTYTGKGSQGIYAWRFEPAANKFSPLGLAAEITSPSFLAIHPNGKWLYAVTEGSTGWVSAFTLDEDTGKLTLLNSVRSRGSSTCYAVTDRTGKHLLVANYGSGSFTVFPIAVDGSLGPASAFIQDAGSGPNKARQEGPHAHSLNPSPDNRYALGADLGLDEVLVFRFDAELGTLAPAEPAFAKAAPGAGPRHLDFHPNGKFAFVINELNSTLRPYAWDKGKLEPLEAVSTLPKEFQGHSTAADVHVHPSGRWVYGSNRGHDSIAVFGIDGRKGSLTPIEIVSSGGKTPRNFAIDPSGNFLLAANQDSNSVVLFRIDRQTGKLTQAGQSLEVGSPVCVKFVP